jgi:hypothetical protein
MRASTAYFAGAGTVIAAIAGGVGGGLLIADMVSPKSSRQGAEQTRLERRMSPEPIPAANEPSEPVQYLAASQLPAAVAAPPAQAQDQTQPANSGSAGAQATDASATAPPATAQAAAPAAQSAAPAAQPVAREQAAASDEAKARNADAKRAAEKRKLERRQQWADRRRQQELRAVEERVREETEPRQEFAPEPARIEMPLIRLFGSD